MPTIAPFKLHLATVIRLGGQGSSSIVLHLDTCLHSNLLVYLSWILMKQRETLASLTNVNTDHNNFNDGDRM